MAMKKKPPEAEKENGERWLVSYADFMTLLLGLFIILYSKAAAQAGAAGAEGFEQYSSTIAGIAEAFGNSIIFDKTGDSIIDGYAGSELMSDYDVEEKSMQEIKEGINEELKDFSDQLSDSIKIIIDEKGVRIRITDTVLFASGQYELNNTAKPLLAMICNVIKEHLPNNYIEVEGHTDNIPIRSGVIASNWELGALRATNVARLLIKDCALSPAYVSATSYGEYQPIATNETADGKSKNRRVEIVILRNHPRNIN